jgi:molecular chaperone GrpE
MANEKQPSSHHAKAKAHHEAQVLDALGRPVSHGVEELERLNQEVQQMKDQHLRMLAEFENTKKRLHREKEEFVRYAAETMVHELLPIVDSLDQALIAVDKQADSEAIIKGVHLIYRQLLGLLEKEGVKRIPTVGQPFDPHQHEALAHAQAQDGEIDGTIVEEVHVGYTMHGKVIRPAMVKVAKKAADSRQQRADSKEQATTEQRSGLDSEGSGELPKAQNPKP